MQSEHSAKPSNEMTTLAGALDDILPCVNAGFRKNRRRRVPWPVDGSTGSGLALLPRTRSPGSLHEGLHLLRSKSAIFVGVHPLEDSLVSRLKFLQ